MPTALITGSGGRACDVAAALQSGEWQPPLRADSVQALDDVCASMPPGSLDCYIQLPPERQAHTTAVTEASAMAEGALARYAAITTVLPLLSEKATVVLVLGDGADGTLPRNLAGAVNDLTRVLAGALRNDYPAGGLRVTLVKDDRSPSEIASVARWPGRHTPPMEWYVDFEPTLGSADWRCELLSLLEPT
jgi:hypothetical protein